MLNRLLIPLLLLLTGCATVHPGSIAETSLEESGLPLKVSAQVVGAQGGKSFSLIYLTFENVGSDWLRIAESQVELDETNAKKVGVVVGRDLVDWAQAVEEQQKIEAHNTALALGTIAAVGAIASAASPDDSVPEALGNIAVAGTLGYVLTETLSRSKDLADGVKTVPETHFYQGFSVPGRLFQRRWLLLSKPTDQAINHLVIRVKTAEGLEGHYAINLPLPTRPNCIAGHCYE